MSVAVTQLFKDTWKNKAGGRQTTRVRYKRRYYDATASPSGMVYEDDWHELRRDEYQVPIRISQSLDQPFQNIFRITEVALRLYNPENKWLYFNEQPSVFCGDDVSPDGYPPVRTLFEISSGYIYPDGTREYVKRFTGVLVETPKPIPGEAVAVATIASMAYRLEKSDASQIRDAFTEEATVPPTGDGSITEFLTQTTGVSHLIKVEATDPSVSPEVFSESPQGNWEVSDTGTLKPAKVTFTGENTPPAGSDIRTSGFAHKKNLTIEEIAVLIFENAGFAASEYEVSPILFPGGLSARRTWDEQAEWEAGSVFTNVDTKLTPGSIKKAWSKFDDFDDGDYTSDPTWTPKINQNSSYSVVSGRLRLYLNSGGSTPIAGMDTAFSKTVGTWHAKIEVATVAPGSANPTDDGCRFMFMQTAAYSGSSPVGAVYGYSLQFAANDGDGSSSGVLLCRHDGRVYSLPSAVLANCGPIPSGEHTWLISRDASGNFTVYMDGVEKGSATDNTYTTSAYLGVHGARGNVNCWMDFRIDDIYFSPIVGNVDVPLADGDAIYETEEFDLLSTPTALGRLDRTIVLNGGSVSFYTAFGAVSGALDAFVEIDGDGQMLSTPNRYGKIRVVISSAAFAESPEVRKIVANFTVNIVNVSLAILGGKAGLSGLERYVQIPDYEFAINPDGKCFIRPKTVSGSPAIELDQDNGIIEAVDFDPAERRVINAPRVRYNEYVEEWDCAAAGHAEPTSETIYGRCPGEEEDFSDIMLANDVNLAEARVVGRFDGNYRPKPILTLRIWDAPWLELSDIVRVSYFDDPKMAAFFAGDPLQRYASSTRAPGSTLSALAASLDCKVVELSPVVGAPDQCIIKLEKILS